MTRLSEIQSTILTAAAARENASLLPVPEGLKAAGKALDRTLRALVRRGLAAETEADDADVAWRREEDGTALGLGITEAGLAAVGVEIDAAAGRDGPEELAPADGPGGATAHPRGKLGEVLAAVGAEDGATIAELSAATRWQPHTTRAALTRLRRRGFDIRLDQAGERKAYKLHAAG